MSQVQEFTLQEAEKLLFSFFSASVGLISDVSIFTFQLIEQAYLKKLDKKTQINEGGEKTFQKFKSLIGRGEEIVSIRVMDNELGDYKRFLKQNKKIYVVLDDLKTDSSIIMFRGRDREKMLEIQGLVDIIHKEETEINPKQFLKAYENANISIASGLTRSELEIFRDFIKNSPCLYAAVRNDNGTYTIMHKPEDSKKINDAIHYANWCFHGNYKEAVREQVEYRIAGRNKVNLDLEDAQKEFYIVSKSNPKNFVHVTEKDITYYKNEMEVSKTSRDYPDFNARAWTMINSLSSPTIFAQEEFSQDIGSRQHVLDTKQTLDVFPSEMLVQEEMLKYNRLRDLVSLKMGHDNESQADWSLYDTSVSYGEFGGHEHIDDTDERNQRRSEFEQMKAAYKDTETRINKEVIQTDNNTLDYIISKAEKEASMQGPSSHEHTHDVER